MYALTAVPNGRPIHDPYGYFATKVEATDKSASIRISFEAGAAAEVLSSQLRGVTIKIKGVKLHAFVRVSGRKRPVRDK